MDSSTNDANARPQGLREQVLFFVRSQSILALVGFGASLAALTVLLPILVGSLGKKQYGAWVLTGGIANYIAIFDLGMSLTTARFVARFRRSEPDKAREAIAVSTLAVTLLGVIVFGVSLAIGDSVERWIGVQGTAFAVRAGALSLTLVLITAVVQSALEGAGRVALGRLLQAGGTISFFLGGVLVVTSSAHKLHDLSIFLVYQSVAVLVVYALFLLQTWDWGMPLRWPHRGTTREVFRFATGAQSAGLLFSAIDPLSRFIVAGFAGTGAVAGLDIAMRVRAQFFDAASSFTRPLLPRFGTERREAAELATRAWRSFAVVAAAAGSFVAAVVFFLLPALFGKGVGLDARGLAAVGILLWIPSTVSLVPYGFLVVHGRASDIFKVQLVAAVIGIALTVALVVPLGPWAPVLGVGLGASISALLITTYARERAGPGTWFGLEGIPVRAGRTLGATAIAAAALLLPLPLVGRLALASLAWLGLLNREVGGFLRI
jgi:O-antigen/teichoic acid export membrane protein